MACYSSLPAELRVQVIKHVWAKQLWTTGRRRESPMKWIATTMKMAEVSDMFRNDVLEAILSHRIEARKELAELRRISHVKCNEMVKNAARLVIMIGKDTGELSPDEMDECGALCEKRMFLGKDFLENDKVYDRLAVQTLALVDAENALSGKAREEWKKPREYRYGAREDVRVDPLPEEMHESFEPLTMGLFRSRVDMEPMLATELGYARALLRNPLLNVMEQTWRSWGVSDI